MPNARVVRALVNAVVRVVRVSLGEEARVIATGYASDVDPPPCIAVSISLTGGLRGPVTWSFSPTLARQVTESMLADNASEEYYASAVAELANMMAGNAAAELEEAGYLVELAPPSLQAAMRQGHKHLVVALDMPSGAMKLMFDVEEAAA